jgi:hypothetical protein
VLHSGRLVEDHLDRVAFYLGWMGKTYGRRQNRVSGRAVDQTVRYAHAIGSRANGASWGLIADQLGYQSRSGAENAVQRGLEASCLIVGLRVAMYGRIERLGVRLRVLKSAVPADMDGSYRATLDHIQHVRLLLRDVPGAGPSQACVRDVAALVARRNPHLPIVDRRARAKRLRSRRSGATLDTMRGEYANRSGVQKALERDVRHLLLEAAAAYFAKELRWIRHLWHDIDLAVRRQPVDVRMLGVRLEVLAELLDNMHVFDVMLTYGHLARKRS